MGLEPSHQMLDKFSKTFFSHLPDHHYADSTNSYGTENTNGMMLKYIEITNGIPIILLPILYLQYNTNKLNWSTYFK